MQPIPVPVTNVTVYPYIDVGGGIGPVVQPVIEHATGTYSVGTLATWVYYNLNLEGGEREALLNKGGSYIASAETQDGAGFQTHWMHCMNTGDNPTFGLSVNAINRDTMMGSPVPENEEENPYIVLGELERLSGVITFPPPAIGMIEVIENGTGQLIATRVGTPHLMGIRVESGLVSPVRVGETLTRVVGQDTRTERTVGYNSLRVVTAGEQPVLLQHFP